MSAIRFVVCAAAHELYDKMGGDDTGIVTPGGSRVTAQGLQRGLTLWYGKERTQQASILLPIGVSAQEVLDDVQKELDQLCMDAKQMKRSR